RRVRPPLRRHGQRRAAPHQRLQQAGGRLAARLERHHPQRLAAVQAHPPRAPERRAALAGDPARRRQLVLPRLSPAVCPRPPRPPPILSPPRRPPGGPVSAPLPPPRPRPAAAAAPAAPAAHFPSPRSSSGPSCWRVSAAALLLARRPPRPGLPGRGWG